MCVCVCVCVGLFGCCYAVHTILALLLKCLFYYSLVAVQSYIDANLHARYRKK